MPCRQIDAASARPDRTAADDSRNGRMLGCETATCQTRSKRFHDPRALSLQAFSMKRILVVEDEQHIAFGIKYNLEAEGYDAEVVARRTDGARAGGNRSAGLRPGDSRPDAPRHERLRHLRDAAPQRERHPGADPQRRHAGRRPHPRVRRRRRPIPGKALRAGRAAEHGPQSARAAEQDARGRRASRLARPTSSAGCTSISTPMS